VSKVVEEINSLNVPAISFNVDVSNVSEIKSMMKKVVDKFGVVDVLANNAEILHTAQIEDISEEEWDRMMAVNLESVFSLSSRCCCI
jgi:3-oxoacyl-[acyl-carrier protein] reductase